MSFQVPAEAYGRFMGRFSEPLADQFVEVAGLTSGQRALDVGCGPGALTARLVPLVGAAGVSAVDPSPPFVSAARQRFPGVDIAVGSAESLDFDDDTFDAALAQLVVHFMQDPVAGLREMSRVTRTGGVVAATVWNHAEGVGPLSHFWSAVREVDPLAADEGGLAGVAEGDLARLFHAAGLGDTRESVLTVEVPFESFDQWWEPYTLGVGPAGAYVASLDEMGSDALRAVCQRGLPAGPFTVTASAWCVAAAVGDT